MALAINEAVVAQRALRLALQSFGLLASTEVRANAEAQPLLSVASGQTFKEYISILRAMTSSKPALFGTSPVQIGEVADVVTWVASASAAAPTALADVDKRLATRSYVAGHSLTIADPLVYYAIGSALRPAAASLWTKLPGVARWVDQLQHQPGLSLAVEGEEAVALPARPALDLGVGKKGKEAAAAPAGAAAAAPAKDKGGKPAAAAAPTPNEEDPVSTCNFLCGVIVDCWKHPESDKLWCEKVDVGEAEPREIASGLQQVFTLEQMKGQRVVIIANLPARKLAGFPSNGMVLCATGPDGTVEFVEPPAGAKPGERVVFAGHEGPAAEPNRVQKKKLWEAVAPDLHVDGERRATWKGIPFTTASGPCTVKSVPAGSLIK